MRKNDKNQIRGQNCNFKLKVEEIFKLFLTLSIFLIKAINTSDQLIDSDVSKTDDKFVLMELHHR